LQRGLCVDVRCYVNVGFCQIIRRRCQQLYERRFRTMPHRAARRLCAVSIALWHRIKLRRRVLRTVAVFDDSNLITGEAVEPEWRPCGLDAV